MLVGGPCDGKAVLVTKSQIEVVVPVVNGKTVAMWDMTESPLEAKWRAATYMWVPIEWTTQTNVRVFEFRP